MIDCPGSSDPVRYTEEKDKDPAGSQEEEEEAGSTSIKPPEFVFVETNRAELGLVDGKKTSSKKVLRDGNGSSSSSSTDVLMSPPALVDRTRELTQQADDSIADVVSTADNMTVSSSLAIPLDEWEPNATLTAVHVGPTSPIKRDDKAFEPPARSPVKSVINTPSVPRSSEPPPTTITSDKTGAENKTTPPLKRASVSVEENLIRMGESEEKAKPVALVRKISNPTAVEIDWDHCERKPNDI